MAGGSPFDPYTVFGMKLPKWQVSGYMMLFFAVGITGFIQYKKLQPPAPLKLEQEEADFVKKYIQKKKEDAATLPAWVRGERTYTPSH
ncbi:hypothetical protein HK102_003040 [Quaeritorhiza haematococci]|nr:hypothetical protein HK102_003040 [Quaeritorhiza haematococci]